MRINNLNGLQPKELTQAGEKAAIATAGFC